MRNELSRGLQCVNWKEEEDRGSRGNTFFQGEDIRGEWQCRKYPSATEKMFNLSMICSQNCAIKFVIGQIPLPIIFLLHGCYSIE